MANVIRVELQKLFSSLVLDDLFVTLKRRDKLLTCSKLPEYEKSIAYCLKHFTRNVGYILCKNRSAVIAVRLK